MPNATVIPPERRTVSGVLYSKPIGPEPFTWGKVRTIHHVGGFAIIEYDRRQPDNMPDEEWEPSVGFHPIVDGKDCGYSHDSLDEALVYCVAWRHELKHRGMSAALNAAPKAAEYMMRMVGP